MKQTNPPQPEHSSYPCFSLYDGDKQKCTQVSEASLGEPMVSAGLQEDWAVSKKSCLEVQQLHALPADCVRAQHMSSPHTQVTHTTGTVAQQLWQLLPLISEFQNRCVLQSLL